MFKEVYRNIVPDSIRIPFYQFRNQIPSKVIQLTDPSVKFMSFRLEKLRNKYSGQRCFIMGNGPSLNKMDLDVFQNEYVWGSNRCYLLFDRINWYPKFYVAVDKRVVPDNADEINELGKELTETLFFFPVLFRNKKILNSAKNVYWYKEIYSSEDNLPNSMFSLNPPKFVYTVRTVTVAMLQMAVFLGFNPIYLIGCDTSYSIPSTVQYERGDSQLLISTEGDPNHFDPTYFGEGKKWHDPHVDRMIFHYEQAKKVCDAIGVNVYNATVGGKLEVFPRVDYLDLF